MLPPAMSEGSTKEPDGATSDATIRDGLTARFAELVDDALRQHEFARTDPIVSVHRFRKAIRKLRALLRLAAPGLSKKRRTELQRRCKTAVAPTGDLRDDDIMPATLARLPALKRAHRKRAALAARLAPPPGRATDAAAVLAEAAHGLGGLGADFAAALTADFDAAALVRGVRRLFARGRAAFGPWAEGAADPETLHELRKRTKELRYALEHTRPAGDRARRRAARTADTLGARLDLHVLRTRLESLDPPPADLARINAEIEALERHDLAQALEAAAGLYGPKPKRFAAVFARSLSAARP